MNSGAIREQRARFEIDDLQMDNSARTDDLGLALVGTSQLDAESIAGDRFEHVHRPERQVETSGGEDRVWAGRRGNTQVLGPDRNQHVRARTDSVGSPQVE